MKAKSSREAWPATPHQKSTWGYLQRYSILWINNSHDKKFLGTSNGLQQAKWVWCPLRNTQAHVFSLTKSLFRNPTQKTLPQKIPLFKKFPFCDKILKKSSDSTHSDSTHMYESGRSLNHSPWCQIQFGGRILVPYASLKSWTTEHFLRKRELHPFNAELTCSSYVGMQKKMHVWKNHLPAK